MAKFYARPHNVPETCNFVKEGGKYEIVCMYNDGLFEIRCDDGFVHFVFVGRVFDFKTHTGWDFIVADENGTEMIVSEYDIPRLMALDNVKDSASSRRSSNVGRYRKSLLNGEFHLQQSQRYQ